MRLRSSSHRWRLTVTTETSASEQLSEEQMHMLASASVAMSKIQYNNNPGIMVLWNACIRQAYVIAEYLGLEEQALMEHTVEVAALAFRIYHQVEGGVESMFCFQSDYLGLDLDDVSEANNLSCDRLMGINERWMRKLGPLTSGIWGYSEA